MVSNSLRNTALAAATLAFTPRAIAIGSSYNLADYYDASNFVNSFDFFNETDPTKGFVTYQSKAAAQADLLAGKTTTGAIYLGVDASSKATSGGRPSVRVSSTKSYDQHLMIADVAHMPFGNAVWGALWELGSGAAWPAGGEIDIVEGVNGQQTQNLMTLHTSDNCQMTNPPNTMSGNMTTTDCYINSANQPGNAGCSVTAPTASSFGAGFNAGGGGVYATEYSADAITIWFFARNAIPTDISDNSSTPNPAGWGTPIAKFAGSCQLSTHFSKLQIIINTSICGSWAGTVWNQTDASGKSPATITGVATCDDYAANHPEAFEQAYWAINSIRVYEPASGAATKRQTELFGAYNSTDDGDSYQKCQEFTPGHCKDSSKAQDMVQSAAVDARTVSWTLMGAAAAMALVASCF